MSVNGRKVLQLCVRWSWPETVMVEESDGDLFTSPAATGPRSASKTLPGTPFCPQEHLATKPDLPSWQEPSVQVAGPSDL